jgi:hypothetical protein
MRSVAIRPFARGAVNVPAAPGRRGDGRDVYLADSGACGTSRLSPPRSRRAPHIAIQAIVLILQWRLYHLFPGAAGDKRLYQLPAIT